MEYWVKRNLKSQEQVFKTATEEINRQLERYYSKTARSVMNQFEATYEKLIKTVAEGKEPTPADLYNLDKYWQLQAQLKKELNDLGNHQCDLFFKRFTDAYEDFYEAIALPSSGNFNVIDRKTAEQMINSIWCADGKSWSKRVWDNTDKLQQMLNDKLIECVVSGKKTSELKKMLMEAFESNYYQANRLVRTEIAHIQTIAAQKRYQDYGIQQVEIWADADERRCDVCGKLHKRKYPAYGALPIPAHANCRCCIIPVVK